MSARFGLVGALLLICGLLASSASAAPPPVLGAAYIVAAPPTSALQSATIQVPVTVQNTGDEPWLTGGTNPVTLSYHWYDAVGNVVVWEGARTPLGADVPLTASRQVQANVVAPSLPGTYRLNFALVKEGAAWFPQSQPFAVTITPAINAATYQIVAPPQSIPAGGSGQFSVAVQNAGNQTWNATGPNQFALSYHWYDGTGNVMIWEGARTPLGADVAPGTARTIAATVNAPSAAGSYVLRFAIVREGIAWLPPSEPIAVNAVPAYFATFTEPALPVFIAGGTYDVPVTIRNSGAATWNATGANLVDVSYHWHDLAGTTVVWDGVRTPLPANVDIGGTTTVTMKIAAPNVAGSYVLTLDLVREGVAWFQQLGATPFRIPANVAQIRFAAAFGVAPQLSGYWVEEKTVPVALTNTGNVAWSAAGPNPVNLSYHILDSSGRAVVWDGRRTPLGGDLLPGQTRSLSIAFTAPASSGDFVLVIDLVREGIGWFADGGAPAARVPLSITSGLSAGYGPTTTPAQVTIGAVVPLQVTVINYGPRTWPAAGANPVSVSYHIRNKAGEAVVWDGARGQLPADVPANSQVNVTINVALPQATGDYTLAWDLVQEGVAWFSTFGVTSKVEPFTVVPGVVFYGKGFGHGIGMSQYGANGWATGAAGITLNAEQIIAKYYPGTTFQFVDAARSQVRVLLSQPSSQSRYRCGDNQYFDGSLGEITSAGGFRVLDEQAANAEIGRSGPNQNWQFVARGAGVEVWNNAGATPQLVKLIPAVAVVPLDPTQPLRFMQKGTYRGNFRLTNLGGTLRVVNVATWDDYVRGVIPLEMPSTWHPEALKAQAYAARSYGYSSYRGGASDYDVSDDQSDQCYGGSRVEVASTNTAVAATAGKLITYNNAAIRAYFASSSGGYTLAFGCWGNRVVRSGGTWVCTPDETQPFLAATPDPADLKVTSPANPRASWNRTFTGTDIRNAVQRCNGVDIGVLQAVDVSNQVPVNVGHVISVRIYGSFGSVDLRADDFLRTCLGLPSTMVRLAPF